jgi:tetratricopeptide (TPR) repeat protein
LTSISFSFILKAFLLLESQQRKHLPSPSSDSARRLAGQLVVFTGKLSLLGRKEARALVARLGGATGDDVSARTTMLVVGAEGFGPPVHASTTGESRTKSQKLRRAEELNAGLSKRIQIISEEDFCQLAGVRSVESLKRQYRALRDLVIRYGSVREDHLRYLVKCGLIRPAHRTNTDLLFGFSDVAIVKQVNEALAQGATFRSAVQSMLAARQGQLELNFRHDATPAKVIALRRPPREGSASTGPPVPEQSTLSKATSKAEQCFLAASALDNGDAVTLDDAATIYRRALQYDPDLAPALINLANIHYSRNELAEAQALYERAIGLESDLFEAHFNLGNVYDDLGRFREAQACYREALRLNPAYADAHFYLAVAFEKAGRSDEARPHWRAYLQLAPDGEWAEIAKEFLD